jgi:hypothetical protein
VQCSAVQVVLALFGQSLGVRRLYVRVLLTILQVHCTELHCTVYCAVQSVQSVQCSAVQPPVRPAPCPPCRGQAFTIRPEEEESSTSLSSSLDSPSLYSSPSSPPWEEYVDCAGPVGTLLSRLLSCHNVISRRDSMILAPDAAQVP